jgi:hypothetical protein
MRIAPRSKYGAQRTTVDGITFDSKREAIRYGQLKLLEQAGEIGSLECQARYILRVATIPIGSYVADFCYTTAAGSHVVEDVKGVRTPLYRWKKKHVEAQYGIVIQET